MSGNRSELDGGGMYNYNSTPIVRNSIFWNNKGAGKTNTITATIHNTNTSNTTLVNSLVESSGGSDGWVLDSSYVNVGGNIDKDPRFTIDIDPTSAPTKLGNLRLQKPSPAIDAGSNTFAEGVTTDLDGEPRAVDGDTDGTPTVDMGAYEYQITYPYNGYLPYLYR